MLVLVINERNLLVFSHDVFLLSFFSNKHYKTKQNKNNEQFALKRLYGQVDWDQGMVFCELQSLVGTFYHPNLIRLYEFHLHEANVNYVMEYMSGGNLHGAIQRRKKKVVMGVQQQPQPHQQRHNCYFLSEPWIQTMTRHVLSAIDHMHRRGFIHRDLKPENILLSHDIIDDDHQHQSSSSSHLPTFKVADFSLARRIVRRCFQQQQGATNSSDHVNNDKSNLTTYVSTRWYRAPEVLQRKTYGFPMDMFAIGCIVAETYVLEALFPGNSEIDQLNLIMNHSPIDKRQLRELLTTTTPKTTSIAVSDDGYDMMEKLLRFNPKERCTAQQALQHPFVASVRPTSTTITASLGNHNQQQQRNDGSVATVSGTTTTTTMEATFTPPPSYRSNRHEQGGEAPAAAAAAVATTFESYSGTSSRYTATTAFTTPATNSAAAAPVTTNRNSSTAHNNSNDSLRRPPGAAAASTTHHVVTTDQQRSRKRNFYNAGGGGRGSGETMMLMTTTKTKTTTATIRNPYYSSKKRKNDSVSPTF